jgi:catechol 2,3-dioxygenase-like lactoylglutathione lyase family enzyme
VAKATGTAAATAFVVSDVLHGEQWEPHFGSADVLRGLWILFEQPRHACPSSGGRDMALSITHTPVYCTDLDEALAFYTQRLGFEVRDDVPMGPEMRWLTVHAPGDPHDLLLAAVDHHIPPADRQAMREIVAKGDLPVFIQVDDLDKTFESLRAAGTEILQEPVDQPYGVRDAAVRDPSGNHLRLSQPLAAQA